MKKPVHIVKSTGEIVPFDESKLRRSLEKSGAGSVEVEDVLKQVKKMLFEGIPTRKIYKKAFSLLKKKSHSFAARYKLKKAIFELGPSGFPFEKYVGELLKSEGFDTKVGVLVKGRCITHEVDVLAEKEGLTFIIECKFHSDESHKCDVKVPLYINSRYHDIKEEWSKSDTAISTLSQGWIVTNTRFTTDAISYGLCAKLILIGWDFPKKGSLKEKIDNAGLHPVTCLNSLTEKEKRVLLDRGVVLSKDIPTSVSALRVLNLSPMRLKKVMTEIDELCHPA